MAAAVDWANGLEITSGSFQVAEVAPAMRRAFEREVRVCRALATGISMVWHPVGWHVFLHILVRVLTHGMCGFVANFDPPSRSRSCTPHPCCALFLACAFLHRSRSK